MLQFQIKFLIINALLKILQCPIVSKGVTYYVKKHLKSSSNAFMWNIGSANNKSLREILGFTITEVLILD